MVDKTKMNYQEYLLTCLIEECSEVQKAATKALRFGLNVGHPEKHTTNAEDIAIEFYELKTIFDILTDNSFLIYKAATEKNKKENFDKYVEISKKLGTLS